MGGRNQPKMGLKGKLIMAFSSCFAQFLGYLMILQRGARRSSLPENSSLTNAHQADVDWKLYFFWQENHIIWGLTWRFTQELRKKMKKKFFFDPKKIRSRTPFAKKWWNYRVKIHAISLFSRCLQGASITLLYIVAHTNCGHLHAISTFLGRSRAEKKAKNWNQF